MKLFNVETDNDDDSVMMTTNSTTIKRSLQN